MEWKANESVLIVGMRCVVLWGFGCRFKEYDVGTQDRGHGS